MALQRESINLIEQVQEILEEYLSPLSLRQIYYQLVARQIIDNNEKEYRKLSRLCVKGRDMGMLEEEYFADRLRTIEKPSTWLDLSDFLVTVKDSYRKSLWENQENYCEVWTEKDALREIIGSITREYDVPLLVVRGQVSRTAIYNAAERFKSESGKKCHLFYCGDFDPSGLSIYHSLKERLRGMGVSAVFERIALAPEHIEQYKLPQDPAKTQDPNFRRFSSEYGDSVVELDALPPDVLQELIKCAIISCLDIERFDKDKQEEEQDVDKLQGMISQLVID